MRSKARHECSRHGVLRQSARQLGLSSVSHICQCLESHTRTLFSSQRSGPSTGTDTAATDQSQPSRLLNLPKELRLTIYTHALTSTTLIIPFSGHKPHPALLRTNKQIRSEAIPIYYKHNRFIARLDGESPGPIHFAQLAGRKNLAKITEFTLYFDFDPELAAEMRSIDSMLCIQTQARAYGAADGCATIIAGLVVAGLPFSALRFTEPFMIDVVEPYDLAEDATCRLQAETGKVVRDKDEGKARKYLLRQAKRGASLALMWRDVFKAGT